MNRIRLHPKGAVRVALAAHHNANDDIFRRLGTSAAVCDLGEQELYLAEELISMYPFVGEGVAQRTALAMLILAIVVSERQGSTCIPLESLDRVMKEFVATTGLDLPTRDLNRALQHITRGHLGSMFGHGDDRQPLIVDRNALYTERARWLEVRVATALRARLLAKVTAAREAAVDSAMQDIMSRSIEHQLSQQQLDAVRAAATGSLTIITGGPGTGKTAVAATVVRVLAQLDSRPLALAAPTGKAAQRLGEVIATGLRQIQSPNQTELALLQQPPQATTLHRLLSFRAGQQREATRSVLPIGALIVDESSMIDLELMAAVLDALAADSTLVLLGDSHQLPAVNAGQIMADVSALAFGSDAQLARRVATLTHSYRMDVRDPDGAAVLQAANAIDAGDIKAVLDSKQAMSHLRKSPAAIEFRGVEFIDTAGSDSRLTPVLTTAWQRMLLPNESEAAAVPELQLVDGRLGTAQSALLDAVFAARTQTRILAVTRGQSTGSDLINQQCHEFASTRWRTNNHAASTWLPGEPVMVVINDHQRGLWNGDQGVLAPLIVDGTSVLRAWFRVGGPRWNQDANIWDRGQWTPFAIESLRDRLQLCWAMTVHKSQGSEMDCAVIIMPHRDTPLLTRELLYTAVTRARKSAVLVGQKSVLLASKRGVARHSRLIDRIVTPTSQHND
jgi:exodeoxyribonuclease V alpha subunit